MKTVTEQKQLNILPDKKKHMVPFGDGNIKSVICHNEMTHAVNKRMESENDEHATFWFLDSLEDSVSKSQVVQW